MSHSCRKLDAETEEVLFSRQISGSDQLKKIFEEYQFNIAKKVHPRGYQVPRDAIDLELFVRDKMKKRKQMESGAQNGAAFAAYGQRSEKSLSGICAQFIKAGSCSRGEYCPNVHDYNRKGSGKKGRGRGKGKGKKGNDKGKGSEKFEGTCNHCGRYGHRKSDCRQLSNEPKGKGKGRKGVKGKGKRKSKGKGKTKQLPTCGNCGKTGHDTASCWTPKAYAAE